ncbi:MAG: hypothetical protein ACK4HE_08200 [Chitinophagaceae bacterium]
MSVSILLSAQYTIPYPNKNKLGNALIDIFNDASNNFKQSRGGTFTARLLPAGKVYRLKVHVPNAIETKIITVNNSVFKYQAVLHFAKCSSYEEAEAAFVKISQQITSSVGKRMMVRTADNTSNDTSVVKEQRIGYMLPRGFFYYNASLQLQRFTASTWLITLRVNGWEPVFYFWIPKNDPLSSNIFSHNFRRVVQRFEASLATNDVQQLLPGFDALVTKDTTGKPMLVFEKSFADLPNAEFEYSNALNNIKASLGSTFVYRFNKVSVGEVSSITFVRDTDFDKLEQRCIELLLDKQIAFTATYRIRILFRQ